ncbi:MAG: flavin-dependent monooxygenase QhpG [Hyphomicrobiales bacterium]
MTACDILVLGAGPAGALTAMLLNARGYRVCVVSAVNRQVRFEGLSDRVRGILGAHECRHALAAVGPTVERHVVWNGAEPEARNREALVERGAFDLGLRQDLVDRGIDLAEATVARISRRDGVWSVDAKGPDGEREIEGRYLVEARGRRAPRKAGVALSGPETTALSREIHDLPHRPMTLIATYRDGWLWAISGGQGHGIVQLFVDGTGGRLPKAGELDRFFAAEVEMVPELRDWIGQGRFHEKAVARNATSYRAAGLVDAGAIRVGDAAAGVDPLSGHGMFEALGSALAASAAVHTIIAKPENTALAQAFYRERAEQAHLRYCRVGRDFYAMERRWPERPFWRARATWPDDEPAHAPPYAGPVEIVARPVIEDGFVVERQVCVTPDHPRGVWRVAEVPLADLVQALHGHEGTALDTHMPALGAAFEVTEDQLATALAWLRARRMLAEGGTIRLIDPA